MNEPTNCGTQLIVILNLYRIVNCKNTSQQKVALTILSSENHVPATTHFWQMWH
jgi:hypothetical protein